MVWYLERRGGRAVDGEGLAAHSLVFAGRLEEGAGFGDRFLEVAVAACSVDLAALVGNELGLEGRNLLERSWRHRRGPIGIHLGLERCRTVAREEALVGIRVEVLCLHDALALWVALEVDVLGIALAAVDAFAVAADRVEPEEILPEDPYTFGQEAPVEDDTEAD